MQNEIKLIKLSNDNLKNENGNLKEKMQLIKDENEMKCN